MTSPLTEPTYCILAALTEPRHGYAVMQWVADATDQRVKLGPGTLYGALTALQERGLIVAVPDPSSGSDRRKVYSLTDRGRDLFLAETSRLESIARLGRSAIQSQGS